MSLRVVDLRGDLVGEVTTSYKPRLLISKLG